MEKSAIVLGKLASSLGRRDEVPNQELAKEIITSVDREAVEVLITNLSNKNKDIQNDCIKVLYEIGEVKPQLIATYINQFLSLLEHKNNRLQWGAMTALGCISAVDPNAIYQHLPVIMEAASKGSVITRDHAVNILINLTGEKEYTNEAITLLMEQLLKSPVNQLPMYAEKMLPVVKGHYKEKVANVLESRLGDVDKESKRKRVEKVVSRLRK